MVPYNLTKHSLVDKDAEQREKMLLRFRVYGDYCFSSLRYNLTAYEDSD